MKVGNVWLFSHVGNSRDNQEDNALIPVVGYLSPDTIFGMSQSRQLHLACAELSGSAFMAAVSDGMGGHACGEMASETVVKYLWDNYQKMIDLVPLGEGFIARELTALNQHVLAVSQTKDAYKGMGATLCGVVAKDGLYFGFHVGDSRMYQYSQGYIKRLSTDHTEGQRLLNLKLLTQQEYEQFAYRKRLYKYMGYKGDLVADVFRISGCTPGTKLILCSDGLSDVLSDEEIAEVLREKAEVPVQGKRLMDQALSRNIRHGDNITLMIIECGREQGI